MILDAGFLISLDRGHRAAQEFLTATLLHDTPLRATHPVVAQVWRNGARQARLARFLSGIAVHPLDNGHAVGTILARAGTSDIVDAHLVSVAIGLSEPVLTADIDDFAALVAWLPADRRPRILPWP